MSFYILIQLITCKNSNASHLFAPYLDLSYFTPPRHDIALANLFSRLVNVRQSVSQLITWAIKQPCGLWIVLRNTDNDIIIYPDMPTIYDIRKTAMLQLLWKNGPILIITTSLWSKKYNVKCKRCVLLTFMIQSIDEHLRNCDLSKTPLLWSNCRGRCDFSFKKEKVYASTKT